MYFEALAIAAELKDYPGGPEVLAKSIMPTIEAMRIIRWPADRLDILGGYLAYHNITLFNYFLALFAALQGARLIRRLEETGDIEFYLAAKTTRTKLLVVRSFAYFASQLVISLGLGAATAFALQSSGEPNTSGAIITLLAGGICIFPVFGLGLLISQFVKSSRTAAGTTAIIVTTLYVLSNIAEKYDWLEPIKYLAPFYYANLSRPVIPGFSTNYLSWILMIVAGFIFIGVSAQLFQVRDIRSTVFGERESEKHSKTHFVPKGLIGDMLWRQRIGIAAWVITSSAFIGVFISLMNGIIDIWAKFAFLEQFAASGFGKTPELQYLAMVYEILPPFVAGFVIQQSGRWASDLNEGRVQLILSTGISRNALIIKRLIATLLGASIMIISTMLVATIGSLWQEANLYPAALGRVFVMSNLFAVAFAAINAALVVILNGRSAVQLLSIYVGAAWLIGFMAPYLNWPTWLVRLSIFDAFGHPFVQWPTLLNFVTIIGAMCLSFVAAVVVSQRKPVVK